MHRRAAAWFGASFLLACVASLGTGALVRDHLRAEQSFWLISPIVYVVRDQHLRALVPFLTPTLTLLLWVPFAIAIVILIHNVRIGKPALSALPEIVVGLFIGGGLANALEAQATGSVTDFLGIHLSGVMLDHATSGQPQSVELSDSGALQVQAGPKGVRPLSSFTDSLTSIFRSRRT